MRRSDAIRALLLWLVYTKSCCDYVTRGLTSLPADMVCVLVVVCGCLYYMFVFLYGPCLMHCVVRGRIVTHTRRIYIRCTALDIYIYIVYNLGRIPIEHGTQSALL